MEEKLELLKEKKHIINPSGWLMAALKNDYQDPEPEKYDKEPVGQASRLSGIPYCPVHTLNLSD
jgi:hypothetical protein